MRQDRNFRAGHLLDASGERTIFSSRSLISRQRWANNIFDDRNPVSIIIIWLQRKYVNKKSKEVLKIVGTSTKIKLGH